MVSEPTVQNMLNSESTIGQPAYEYIPEEAVAQSLESQARKLAELGSNKHQTMRYHNRNTTEEEKEEFAIAGAFEESKNLKELGNLLRDGKMKEFYQIANKVLRIKRNHPVVTAVKRENENGESEIFEERGLVEQAIAEYFSRIYKRPDHMPA